VAKINKLKQQYKIFLEWVFFNIVHDFIIYCGSSHIAVSERAHSVINRGWAGAKGRSPRHSQVAHARVTPDRYDQASRVAASY